MFFIFKATFKIIYFCLALFGAYCLYSTNLQPGDFFRDTKEAVEKNIAGFDLGEVKNQATEKISTIIVNNKDSAKEVVEEKIKVAVDEAVEKTKNNVTLSSSTEMTVKENHEVVKESAVLSSKISGCRQGYYFSEVFVAGCVQIDCEKIAGAKLSEYGRCGCETGKKEIFKEIGFKECPGCLAECI